MCCLPRKIMLAAKVFDELFIKSFFVIAKSDVIDNVLNRFMTTNKIKFFASIAKIGIFTSQVAVHMKLLGYNFFQLYLIGAFNCSMSKMFVENGNIINAVLKHLNKHKKSLWRLIFVWIIARF